VEGLELGVLLGSTILAGGVIARRLRVAEPLVLVLLGAILGFVPFLRGVQLPSEVVLLLFLPAILYWESLNTSLRTIRRDLRSVLAPTDATAVGIVASRLPRGPLTILVRRALPSRGVVVPEVADRLGSPPEARDALRRTYEGQLRRVVAGVRPEVADQPAA
jgi:hypothetical protein